ncbi:DUF6884 domain-containing protein [Aeromicrobium sp.]|uniref:DUF7669 domain-containing protein n=1 Tax=Aeromicrobium sp. TaxID=1871063 RepID=UPI0019C782FF|nr:DUF6884 domain-containing protein [Aeromicrobium sp.]MBC7630606.1 hypothetical protein [Aeromicrobium sp.]
MKYDKPVWQIMHDCAGALPEVFRYEQVRDWFDQHYPDVNEATIRAHLIGLTEGGRTKHVQFAQRAPLFRRVARGEYRSIPLAERGEDPHGDVRAGSSLTLASVVPSSNPATDSAVSDRAVHPDGVTKAGHRSAANLDAATRPATDAPVRDADIPDIVLLGSVGERVNVPAPAKEVFRDVSFQLSRVNAELSGSEWFVLSAEHGLLAPDEWVSPDSRTLAEMDPDYRIVWASWVVARLQSLTGSLEGMHVRLDAPDAFIDPLFADLQNVGAVVSAGSIASTARTFSRGAPASSEPVASGTTRADDLVKEKVATPLFLTTIEAAEVAPVVPLHVDNPASLHLSDLQHAVPLSELASLPDLPGLYGWFVDPVGARDLNRCLLLPVRSGLIFVGQVGGPSWQSLADPVLNLRDHVERIQLHGRARASTFRMTLATVLREYLRMSSLEDPRLTSWMTEHLSIAVWPSLESGELRNLEQQVVSELDPPLNVDHLPANEYRARLNQMRRALA